MRISAKLAYLGIGTIVLLAGCSSLSSINPFASKSTPRNVPAALIELKPSVAIRTVWSTTIGNAGVFVFSPSFVNGNVFVAAADGAIANIEAASGRFLWRINAGMPLTAGIGSDGNTIVVTGEKGAILAFDHSGKLRWKAQASSEVLSAPAVAQGLVIVRSVDNHIAAFDAESGVRKWIIQRTIPPLTLRTAPGILISGMAAYVALPGGKLLSLALNNGSLRWEGIVGDPRGATELERIADLSGTPVIWGGKVCAVAYQGRAACFDANSGVLGWAKKLSSDVGLGADERFVFAADENGVVSAFTGDAGINVWRNDKLANRRLATPVAFGRAVAVGDGQGFVHFLSREDGSFLARASTDGSPVIGTPVIAGTNFIFQTQSGTVAAFAAE
jgi:outer membrane protein assembly factor BamB